MVGLHETKSEATATSIRNKTGRLNRSLEANMKSAKEDGYDSGGGGLQDHKRGAATLQELDVHHGHGEEQPSQDRSGADRLLVEDSSSTHSNQPDPYDMLITQQQQPHRTPRQHQSHQKPPHHLVPITRRTPRQQSKDTSDEPRQHWGKNIEDSISGILKRLDQLAAGREAADIASKKNGLVVPQGRPGLITNHVQHRDITSERLQFTKDRERMTQRIEELEKVVERLTNENRQWKTRIEDLMAENRHLQLVKYPPDELKSRSSLLVTDKKGRSSVVLADQNALRNDGSWLSLWNVLPHVGPVVPEPGNFQPPHPEILLRCLQINLQHKKKAMERTKRLLVDRNIDIALIQEPYALGTAAPEMYGVPAGYTAFHNLTEHHTSGAAVIAKNTLRAKMCSYGRNDIAGIQLRSGNKTYHFYSVFCRPSSLNLSATMMPLLDQAPPTLVIGMDASAKHPKWNNGMVYRKIDQRGRELERLLDQYDMHLASPPLYKLKYIPENYTFIDVTLGGENIQFHDWKFWEDSLSDHPYIFFQVE